MFATLLTILTVALAAMVLDDYRRKAELESERDFFYRDPAGWGATHSTKYKCNFAQEEQRRLARGH